MNSTRLHMLLASLFAAGSCSAWAAGETSAADAIPAASEAVRNPSNVFSGATDYEASGVPVAAMRQIRPLRVTDGINVFADTGLNMGYDSNVTQGRTGFEVSSMFFRVTPTVTAETLYRANRYDLSYKGDYVRYPSYNPNSLMQNDLIFEAAHGMTTRTTLKWGASVGDHYDPIGSTDRSISNTEADHYRSWAANGTFAYGAEEAKGRLELDAAVGGKRYLNNRATTESADVANTNLGARFFYRVAPKTRLLTEYRRTTYSYDHDTDQLDNTDMRYLVGATWDATSAITGAAKLGLQQKNYKESSRKDFTGTTWEASVRWKPLTYTSFDLITGRSASDPSGTTGMPVAKNLMLSWNHDWRSYFHSKISAGRMRTNFRDENRKDVQDVYSVGMMYDLRRWLGVGLEYSFSNRDSTVDTYDYVRRLSMVKLEASF